MSPVKNKDLWERIHQMVAKQEEISAEKADLDEKELKKLWKKRAQELAKAAEERQEALSKAFKVIILKIGDENYAFRITEVEEIMRLAPMTSVPCVPDHLIGVVNRRGNILPVVDLGLFFGGGKCPKKTDSRIVVLSRRRSTLGFLVEKADKIISIREDEVKPPLKKTGRIQEQFCSGVITLGKQMMVLIDASRLLEDDRMTIDEGV